MIEILLNLGMVYIKQDMQYYVLFFLDNLLCLKFKMLTSNRSLVYTKYVEYPPNESRLHPNNLH